MLPRLRHKPGRTAQLVGQSLSSFSRSILYLAVGLGMLWILFVAMAGYSVMDKASRRNHDAESEPPPYTLRRHFMQFLPAVFMTLGAAVSLKKSQPFISRILGILGRVSLCIAVVCIVYLVPTAIMWLIIKKLHLEPYKTIRHRVTTAAPFLMMPPFAFLLLIEAFSVFSPSSAGPLWYFIQHAPLAARGFKWFGMGTYALIATWRATDATAAYFYTRGIATMNLPPGFIPPELLKFLPEGANRFFIAPLLLPTAMIVNGCMYADVPPTSAIAVIGSITLAVAAVWVYVLFVYGTFAFIGLRDQPIASVKAPPAGNGKDVGWITRNGDLCLRIRFG